MFYEPTEETMNLTHVVEDVNGEVLVVACNWMTARQFRRYQDVFLLKTCTIRLANEDDLAALGRGLVDE